MESVPTRFRRFLACVTAAIAIGAFTGFFPSKALCQEGEDCEVGDVTVEERGDEVWVCISEFECNNRKGKNVCVQIA